MATPSSWSPRRRHAGEPGLVLHRELIAEPLAGPDRERAWECVVREYPLFTGYQQKVARQIPVVRLRPAPGA